MSAKKAAKKAGKKAAKKAPNGFRKAQEGMSKLLDEMPKEPAVPTEVEPPAMPHEPMPTALELIEKSMAEAGAELGPGESIVYGPLGSAVGDDVNEWEDVPRDNQNPLTDLPAEHQQVLKEEIATAMNEMVVLPSDIQLSIQTTIPKKDIITSLQNLIIAARFLYKKAEKKRVPYQAEDIVKIRGWIDEAERQIKVLKDEEAQVPAQG